MVSKIIELNVTTVYGDNDYDYHVHYNFLFTVMATIL